MKIARLELLLDQGSFSTIAEWKKIYSDIQDAVTQITWPKETDKFILHDEFGKPRGKGNGVRPIKDAFIRHLEMRGWTAENRQLFQPETKNKDKKYPGAIDATFPVAKKFFCVEWETGNISSSHRALNKMALGLLQNIIIGGILVLPTASMAYYLTDRIGNFPELEPYFPLWRSLPVTSGILGVVAVEHDGVSKDVPRIPKGKDGLAIV